MRRRFFQIWSVMLVLCAQVGHADVLTDQAETLTRINLVGQQRLLAVEISMSACMVMTGVDVEANAALVKTSADTFERFSVALQAGDPDLALPPETHPEILANYTVVGHSWQTFAAASRQIAWGDIQSVTVRQVLALGPVIVRDIQIAAELVETVYREKLVTKKEMTRTIDIAARQGMLAMLLGQQFCFAALDINRAAMQDDLRATMELFAVSMDAMANGDYDMGIIDPPSLAALGTMQDMKGLWENAVPVLDIALADPDNARDVLQDLEPITLSLLDLSQKMLKIYLN